MTTERFFPFSLIELQFKQKLFDQQRQTNTFQIQIAMNGCSLLRTIVSNLDDTFILIYIVFDKSIDN